jgi:lipid-binding SYLF domain-containing protein
VLLCAPHVLGRPEDDKKDDEIRFKNAGTVLQEIQEIPDDIPQDVLNKARCVVVLPSVLKGAFIAGGSYGAGLDGWPHGQELRRPVGCSGNVWYMRSEMLSYSRECLSASYLEGSTLRPDEDANHGIYGDSFNAVKIITEPEIDAPAFGQMLVERLQKASPTLKP